MTEHFRQESFAAGELSTRIRQRTGLSKYAVGLRRAHNFFISIEGAALNRAGTWLVLETKDSGNKKPRLFPFIYSELPYQAYAMEFGEKYIRFHVAGATIVPNPADLVAWDGTVTYAKGAWVSSGGQAYRSLQDGNLNQAAAVGAWWEQLPFFEVLTPYLEADLDRLQFAQVEDVVTITHPSYAPMELKRYAHSRWELVPLSFDVPTSSLWAHLASFGAQPGVNGGNAIPDANHLGRPWRWFLTTVERDPVTGIVRETAPIEVTKYSGMGGLALFGQFIVAPPAWIYNDLPALRSVTPDRPFEIRSGGYDGSPVIPLYNNDIIAVMLYRGQEKDAGFVNTGMAQRGNDPARIIGFSVWDDGQEPDLTLGPPQARNPFKVFDGQGALLRTENPACVTYYERRRIFANLAVGATPYRPSTILASATNDRFNFDQHMVSKDTDGMEFGELAARLRQEIRWVLGADKLLVGTGSAVWAVGGAGGHPLAPSTVDPKIQSEVGTAWIPPLFAGDQVLYVRSRQTGVRELLYDWGRQKFAGSDLDVLARHLFVGHKIVAAAYSEEPWSIAWFVRDDGVLLSCTYKREQDVWAWGWHDTDGVVESICSIPEGSEDVLYLVVRRTIGGAQRRFVERMASRVVTEDTDVAECLFLDCAVTIRNTAAVDPVAIAGLGHLEGKTVVALVDGDVVRTDPDGNPLVVAGGQVSIPNPPAGSLGVVHVGLPMLAELEALDLVVPGREARTFPKSVATATLEVELSRGFEVAESIADERGEPTPDDAWTEWQERDVRDDYDRIALFTGQVEISAFASWNTGGRAALRQRDPLPCTVLALTREVEIGAG